MKKTTLTLLLASLSIASHAAQTIEKVAIANDIVTIHMSENRTDTIASCVSQDQHNTWAFSLTSSQGKNLYRAAIAAHSGNKTVEISGANDCQAQQGIERPQAIEILLGS
ncbi:hypothetical protein [Thalassotalea ganghwensis]